MDKLNITATDRWNYIKGDPQGAINLLTLLYAGKGTPAQFDTMVDRIITARVQSGMQKLEEV